MNTPTNTTPVQYVDTRHGSLAYTSVGQGHPLILLHGNTMTAHSQQRLAHHFTDTHQVISLDMLGHGYSARPDNLFTTNYFVMQGQALVDLLTALLPDTPAPVFGMSAGGIAAMHAVCETTTHISALILDSVFRYVGPETLDVHCKRVQNSSPTWDRYMRTQHGEEWWPHLRDGLLSTIEQMARTKMSTTPCLTDSHPPTLIFQGGRDPFCPPDRGYDLANDMPRARLVYDSSAGHILAWKYPTAFRAIVRDFLTV